MKKRARTRVEFVALLFGIVCFFSQSQQASGETFTSYGSFIAAAESQGFAIESFADFPEVVRAGDVVNGVQYNFILGDGSTEAVRHVTESSFSGYSLGRDNSGFTPDDVIRLVFPSPVNSFGIYFNTPLGYRYRLLSHSSEPEIIQTTSDSSYDIASFQFLGIVSDTPITSVTISGGNSFADGSIIDWTVPRMVMGRKTVENIIFENGDFELPAIPNLEWRNVSVLPGWIDLQRIQIHGPRLWESAGGVQHIEFDRPNATISHQVEVTPGTSYVVRFSLGGNPDRNAVYGLSVSVGNQSSDFQFSSSGHSRADVGWQDERFYFTATRETEIIRFTRNSNGPNGFGPLLDKVSVSPLLADDFTVDRFGEELPLLLNGSASIVYDGEQSVLRLTSARRNQRGSAFASSRYVRQGFSTFFQFRITAPGGTIFDCNTESGADGIVFVVQSNSRSALGILGEGIGYRGMHNSVGVEFDSWCNAFHNDPNSNHVAIDINGDVDHGAFQNHTVNVTPNFDNGEVWSVWIDYSGTVLEVRLSTDGLRPEEPLLTREILFSDFLGSSSVGFPGFTSGTGADFGNHDILNWVFRNQYDPIGSTSIGDFNNDFRLTATDVDTLISAIRGGSSLLKFDLNGDSLVSFEDLETWVLDIRGTFFGDANLDGQFNSADLVTVFQSGQYEDGIPGNSGWTEGDWNGDGEFSSSDLVKAFQDGGYEQGLRP